MVEGLEHLALGRVKVESKAEGHEYLAVAPGVPVDHEGQLAVQLLHEVAELLTVCDV